MTKARKLEKQTKEIEEEIIQWAKLLATCKSDSTRFESRVTNIERLMQARRGLHSLQGWRVRCLEGKVKAR